MNGNIDLLKNYILITPCKNESKNLVALIDSIVLQTIKPIIWVIIDDGSTDNTPYILKEYENKYKWIKILQLEPNPRDLGLHLAKIMMKGFDYATTFCKNMGLEYYYLGNVDADITLPSHFFSNLIKEFENDACLGVASGGTIHIIGDKKIRANLSKNEPSGGHMLIRRMCFEECGGLPLSYAMDSVMKAKARLKGWNTRRFEENMATEIRDVSAAEGYWKGLKHVGKTSYYLNANPLHILVRSMKYLFKKPHYGCIAFLVGYFGGVIGRNEQTEDKEIRNYFWNKWKEHL